MSEQSPQEELLERSVVDSLMQKYQAEPNVYLATSSKLIESSKKPLSRDVMEKIFRDKSEYYPQLKVIETSIDHVTVHITPDVARKILMNSSRGTVNPENKNRRVSKATIKRYAEAMKKREWCLTGEPIIFSDDGELLNGHTRLEAAAQSDRGFITVITHGVTDDLSFAHIDVGKIRSRAQVLEMSGVTVDANVLSKVAMLAKAFELTKNPYAFRGTQGSSFQQAEILRYVEEHEELALSVDFVSTLAKKHKQEIQAAQPIYAFAHYLIKIQLASCEFETIPITPESYISRVISGIGIQTEDDIEYQVRNFLQTLVGESSSYALLCRLSAIFKGFNVYLGLPVVGNKIAVRRVAKFTRDEEGEKIPAKGAGNIKEAFTVPCIKRGKIPRHIDQQANMVEVM